MKKTKPYNIDNISRLNATFNFIYGEKANGKSWQVKHKIAVIHYLETGKRFILLRRWREDITNLWAEQYFADVDVEGLTNGKWELIIIYRKVLYFARFEGEDEIEKKLVKGDKIGYVMALSTEQHYSSGSFLDVDTIIFEEFMERNGTYIKDEVKRLEIFYSTVDRKRGTTTVWFVGNSISRICPYLQEWGLDSIIKKQKQGDIDTKIIHNEENDIVIAVEYCESAGR